MSKRLLALALFVAASLGGCDRASGQWVLESYDAQKGYTFSKGDARYQAHCVSYGQLAADGSQPFSSPIAVMHGQMMWVNPQTPANLFGPSREDTCSPIMPYLHKPTPMLLDDSGVALIFVPPVSDLKNKDYPNGYAFKFVIETAK